MSVVGRASALRRGLAVPLYGGFLLTGIATVLLGPLIPELRDRWGLPTDRLAALFVAQFTASSIGSLLSSLHLGRSLLIGYSCMAVGVAVVIPAGWPLAGAAVALMGFGLGLVIPATNLAVAHLFAERRGSALNVLNLFWGLGAAGCPLLLAALAGRASTPRILLALVGALAAVALLLALPGNRRDVRGAVSAVRSPAGGESRAATVLPFAAMLFLYVGIESSIGGWVVALGALTLGESARASLLVGAGFWSALLAGRAGAPLVLRRLSERTFYALALGVAGGGTLALCLATSPAIAAGGAILSGIGLAPLFPLTVSMLAHATAADGSRGSGWAFAMGGLGGALLPWLAGQADGLRWAFLVPLGGLGVLAILFATRATTVLRRPAPEPSLR